MEISKINRIKIWWDCLMASCEELKEFFPHFDIDWLNWRSALANDFEEFEYLFNFLDELDGVSNSAGF